MENARYSILPPAQPQSHPEQWAGIAREHLWVLRGQLSLLLVKDPSEWSDDWFRACKKSLIQANRAASRAARAVQQS